MLQSNWTFTRPMKDDHTHRSAFSVPCSSTHHGCRVRWQTICTSLSSITTSKNTKQREQYRDVLMEQPVSDCVKSALLHVSSPAVGHDTAQRCRPVVYFEGNEGREGGIGCSLAPYWSGVGGFRGWGGSRREEGVDAGARDSEDDYCCEWALRI